LYSKIKAIGSFFIVGEVKHNSLHKATLKKVWKWLDSMWVGASDFSPTKQKN